MSRLHSTLVALVLSAATAAGLFAAVKTVQLGQKASAPKAAPAAAREIASRQAKLDRWSKSLQQSRAKRPPALPKLPRYQPVHARPAAPASSSASPAATAEAKVKYVRPTVVRYRHASTPKTSTTSAGSSRSDDEGTSDDGGASDDGSSDGGD
jgi:hypothetical protein